MRLAAHALRRDSCSCGEVRQRVHAFCAVGADASRAQPAAFVFDACWSAQIVGSAARAFVAGVYCVLARCGPYLVKIRLQNVGRIWRPVPRGRSEHAPSDHCSVIRRAFLRFFFSGPSGEHQFREHLVEHLFAPPAALGSSSFSAFLVHRVHRAKTETLFEHLFRGSRQRGVGVLPGASARVTAHMCANMLGTYLGACARVRVRA